MKIIWFSRHEPIQKQITELKRIFGSDVEIILDSNPFSNADDVANRFKRSGAEEMVVVAPLSVIIELIKRGIRPLYAEMKLVQGNEYDVTVNGRKFVFDRFVRITAIEVKKEEL
jgi:hypothetical protein